MPRANLFDEDDEATGGANLALGGEPVPDLDLSSFAPIPRPPSLDREAVKQAAEDRGFRDREPISFSAPATMRQMRRYRTGRSIQLNLKVTLETRDLFDRLAGTEPYAVTFERALAALAREQGLS